MPIIIDRLAEKILELEDLLEHQAISLTNLNSKLRNTNSNLISLL